MAEGKLCAGEVTLTGRVLPIGGIKEKALAARRSDVKTLLFPQGNKKDWDELKGVHCLKTCPSVSSMSKQGSPSSWCSTLNDVHAHWLISCQLPCGLVHALAVLQKVLHVPPVTLASAVLCFLSMDCIGYR